MCDEPYTEENQIVRLRGGGKARIIHMAAGNGTLATWRASLLSAHLAAVSSGGGGDLYVADNSEVDSGFTYNGATVYRRNFTGNSTTDSIKLMDDGDFTTILYIERALMRLSTTLDLISFGSGDANTWFLWIQVSDGALYMQRLGTINSNYSVTILYTH